MSFAAENEIVICDNVKKEEFGKVTFEKIYLGKQITVRVFPYRLKFFAAVIIRTRPILSPLKVELIINEESSKINEIPINIEVNSQHFVFVGEFEELFESSSKFKIKISDSDNNLLCQREVNVILGDSPNDENNIIYDVTNI